jgi:hypothetical protein
VLAAVAVAIGCGASAGSASVNGMVGGVSFQPHDAVVHPVQPSATAIDIVSAANICDDFTQHGYPKNTTAITLYIKPIPAAPGTFTTESGALQATWEVVDATCASTSFNQATTGTVALTSVTDSSIQGTFDLTFDTDHVSGNFDAVLCDPSIDASAGPTCL